MYSGGVRLYQVTITNYFCQSGAAVIGINSWVERFARTLQNAYETNKPAPECR